MVKKSNQKRHQGNNANDEIIDSRFTAAATRPQFHKAKRSSSTYNNANSNNKNAAKSATTTTSTAGGTNNDNSASSSGVLQSSGLGDSLTAAIQSDDRFSAALLNSDKFGCVPTRDKYGRKTKKKKKERSQKDDESEESDDESSGKNGENANDKVDTQEEEGVEQDNSMEARIAYLNALSRGDISGSSSSESSNDSESSDDDSDDDNSSTSSTNIHGKSGIFDPSHKSHHDIHDEEEIDLTTIPSPYLCLLNLNWEHTRAVDVYAMLHSFCPPGTLKEVSVYPSDFGRERMERERVEGPTGLWKREKQDGEDDSSDGDEVDGEDELEGQDNTSKSDGDEQSEEELKKRDSDDDNNSDDNDSQSDDEELTLSEATSKLYAHFPPQSTITKNSQLQTPEEEEEGFDPEKLREYEVSKLKYFFCVATFHSSEAAEAVYENVDGLEMEASAAEIDVRVLPIDAYQGTVEGRAVRDDCSALPAKYTPPEDAAVSALRQSRVQCSWERGDADRERKLTRWGMGKDAWEAMAEGDDIKLFLATSDNSSCGEDSDSDEENKEVKGEKEKKKKKGSGMRAMLGLAGSDSEDSYKNQQDMEDQSISDDSSTESESESDGNNEEDDNKQVTFTPGKSNLAGKIRSKLQSKQNDTVDADPSRANNDFEKYLEKQKAKRRERRQAARSKQKNDNDGSNDDDDDDDEDGMYGDDPEFGRAQFSDEEFGKEGNNDKLGKAGHAADKEEKFFLGETSSQSRKANNKKKKDQQGKVSSIIEGSVRSKTAASTKEELELIVAGDDDEEHTKDYDMRGLVKLQKHANKKLKGKRKRKLKTLSDNVSGQDFQIDTTDDRFSALLEGKDDRFGIDRTSSSYKETGAMRAMLAEQSKRRKSNRDNGNNKGAGKLSKKEKNRNGDRGDGGWVEMSSGAIQLSSLVKSLQTKVSRNVDGSSKKRKKKAK